MHHLAAVASPPCASVVDYALRGDSANYSGFLERVCLAMRVVPPGDICSVSVFEALSAWRHMSPAKRSRRVKHVAFLELWLRMTSLELWLGIADEHEELLSYGSGWRVLPV
ncbi:hypothetical protein DEO72_LG6g954 [Vigna unguiculata]|uniref:Uncharacterized protein n=1 Tax=Vigna unguiculata TaxID=3917 RepID=A0A4D6M4Q2_VIGUN|nr:hypothetical protein DEO72_LG6g954 [Vigna unguiculata]